MARGSSRRGTRGHTTSASDPLVQAGLLPAPVIRPLKMHIPVAEYVDQALSQVEDLRTFHPDRQLRQRATVTGVKARNDVVLGRSMQSIGFREPHHVVVCLKRKRRREVIFAKRKNRKGAGARRRRNFFSNVRC